MPRYAQYFNAGSFQPTRVKHNHSASAAPTANDDSADGYEVGSVWIDTTNDEIYFCLDATAGAAVWDQGGGGGTPASTVEDETTWGISPAVGTDTEYARQDHTHGTPADPSLTPASTVEDETSFGVSSAVGTDTEYARQDHTHGTPANPVTAAAVKALGRWEPVQFDDGSSPWPFVYASDEIVVAWVDA